MQTMILLANANMFAGLQVVLFAQMAIGVVLFARVFRLLVRYGNRQDDLQQLMAARARATGRR